MWVWLLNLQIQHLFPRIVPAGGEDLGDLVPLDADVGVVCGDVLAQLRDEYRVF